MSPDTHPTGVEAAEDELSRVGLAAAESLRVAEVVGIGFLALLFCPPLLILVVIVVVPLVAFTVLVGLVGGVLALPVLAVRHHHRHTAGRAHERIHRLARLGRAKLGSETTALRRLLVRTPSGR